MKTLFGYHIHVGCLTFSFEGSAKVVSATAMCNETAAGGTSEVSDLGPDNREAAVGATATFTFSTAAQYKVCFKVTGENYKQVPSL